MGGDAMNWQRGLRGVTTRYSVGEEDGTAAPWTEQIKRHEARDIVLLLSQDLRLLLDGEAGDKARERIAEHMERAEVWLGV